MKKRNKKYNPHRTAIHFAKSYTKNFAMVWAGTLDAKIYNIKNNSKAILTQAKMDALTKISHKWQVHVAVLLRDNNGRDYIQTPPNTPNTCLLYTSPSPRDRQKARMPSSA